MKHNTVNAYISKSYALPGCKFSGTGGKPTSTRNKRYLILCLFLAGRKALPDVKIEQYSLCACLTVCNLSAPTSFSKLVSSILKRSFLVQ